MSNPPFSSEEPSLHERGERPEHKGVTITENAKAWFEARGAGQEQIGELVETVGRFRYHDPLELARAMAERTDVMAEVKVVNLQDPTDHGRDYLLVTMPGFYDFTDLSITKGQCHELAIKGMFALEDWLGPINGALLERARESAKQDAAYTRRDDAWAEQMAQKKAAKAKLVLINACGTSPTHFRLPPEQLDYASPDDNVAHHWLAVVQAGQLGAGGSWRKPSYPLIDPSFRLITMSDEPVGQGKNKRRYTTATAYRRDPSQHPGNPDGKWEEMTMVGSYELDNEGFLARQPTGSEFAMGFSTDGKYFYWGGFTQRKGIDPKGSIDIKSPILPCVRVSLEDAGTIDCMYVDGELITTKKDIVLSETCKQEVIAILLELGKMSFTYTGAGT